jgi:hypothetical protein
MSFHFSNAKVGIILLIGGNKNGTYLLDIKNMSE